MNVNIESNRQHFRRRVIPKPRLTTKGFEQIPYLSNEKEKFARYDKESKLAKAYEIALDTRKFEIELYWKRATYFWAIAAVILGAIGLIVANSIKDGRLNTYPILFMLEALSCVGFIVTKAWNYVNLGGKFWQHNWELHVDVLEQEVLFPLFRTVLAECTAATVSTTIIPSEKNPDDVAADASATDEVQLSPLEINKSRDPQPHNDKKSGDQKKSQQEEEKDGLTVVFSPSKVNEFLGRFLNTIFMVIGFSTFSLILLRSGIFDAVTKTLGIDTVEHLITRFSSIWMLLAAALPILYTLFFWTRMAATARTTTLHTHSLNVTQRDIVLTERIALPEGKSKRFRDGIVQIRSEIFPSDHTVKAFRSAIEKFPGRRQNATVQQKTPGQENV